MKGVNTGARVVFAENLRRVMIEKNIEQADLVVKLGITASTISDWVNGKKYPRIDAMQRLADAIGIDMGVLQFGKEYMLANAIPVGSFVPVPIVGTVRAGYGGVAFEDRSGYEYADVRRPQDYIYFRVSGDSMAPQINAGELALVHIQEDVETGELAVVIIDGEEGTIKRVIKAENSIALQAFNPAYPTHIFTGPEINELSIVGKVVETKRKW